ncbi:MAG: hypothetical protein E7340_03295 [Clostridiales bacterium]|nr:hypothetical protein [Clostridiales bacterium]
MIDCCEENIYYKRKKRGKGNGVIALILCFVIIIGIVAYYKCFIVKKINQICIDYTNTYCALSANEAILGVLNDGVDYNDLVFIEKNNSGEVVLMSANALKVNLISQKIVSKTEENLSNRLEKGVPIPFLVFLGFDMFKGYGQEIDYKSVFISSVECDFLSNFKSVGINQTLHTISVVVKCKVKVESFLQNEIQEFTAPFIISETVLVGSVPEVYLNGKLFN